MTEKATANIREWLKNLFQKGAERDFQDRNYLGGFVLVFLCAALSTRK